MELCRIQLTLRALHCRNRADWCLRNNLKPFRCLWDIIGVTHPADCLWLYTLEDSTAVIYIHFGSAILTDWRSFHGTSKHICHQLRAITDSENRNSQIKYFLLIAWWILAIHAIWATRENDSLWIHFLDLVERQGVRMHLCIHITFTDTTCNQLVVLTTKIKHDNHFLIHVRLPSSLIYCISCHHAITWWPAHASACFIISCVVTTIVYNYSSSYYIL